MWRGLVKEYIEFFEVRDEAHIVTLHEGNTPLIPSRHIGPSLKRPLDIRFKFEGLNPTGSFKDRGMTYALTKAMEQGSKAVICASTGNTSASAAAYATRAGMRCVVLIPNGKIALGKLSQAMIHGATVVQVDGNFDQALTMVREISERYPITLVNSLNPNRIEGQKTAAFEICDALGRVPEFHALPVGNAGNITAYWRGYTQYRDCGKTGGRPKMIGFQAAGSAPIVLGKPVENPETVATAIRIGNPASWKQAIAARDESGGLIDMVTDDEILAAYRMLAGREGVFCEPASAASLAGVLKLSEQDYFAGGETVVCTLTGHGLKDPDNAIKQAPAPVTVPADITALMDILKL